MGEILDQSREGKRQKKVRKERKRKRLSAYPNKMQILYIEFSYDDILDRNPSKACIRW